MAGDGVVRKECLWRTKVLQQRVLLCTLNRVLLVVPGEHLVFARTLGCLRAGAEAHVFRSCLAREVLLPLWRGAVAVLTRLKPARRASR